MDPAVSRRIADAVLKKAYDIDSTFVFLEGKRLEEFMNSKRGIWKATADSVLAVYRLSAEDGQQ